MISCNSVCRKTHSSLFWSGKQTRKSLFQCSTTDETFPVTCGGNDIRGRVQVLSQHIAIYQTDGCGKLALVGFSPGGAYAFDTS
jgi:hypothetical protein